MSKFYIDDFDTSVVYVEAWTSSINVQRSHNNTIRFTNSTNANVTLTFTGITIKVFGAIGSQATSRSSYSLDGRDPTFFRTTAGVLIFDELSYTYLVVGNGQHNLTVENLGDELLIDYFNATAGVSTNSSTSTTIGSSTASGNVLPTSTGKSTDANLLPNNTGSTHHVGAIVGAIAALLCIIGIFFLWLRRRRKQEKPEGRMIFPFSAARAASVLPTQVPPSPMDERPTQPLQSPAYPLSEPPAYYSDIGPAKLLTPNFVQ